MNARRYAVGDVIPDRGEVLAVWSTAYQVRQMADWYGVRKIVVVPFYGPHGIDEQAPVEGLVMFADGSRYGGAR